MNFSRVFESFFLIPKNFEYGNCFFISGQVGETFYNRSFKTPYFNYVHPVHNTHLNIFNIRHFFHSAKKNLWNTNFWTASFAENFLICEVFSFLLMLVFCHRILESYFWFSKKEGIFGTENNCITLNFLFRK